MAQLSLSWEEKKKSFFAFIKNILTVSMESSAPKLQASEMLNCVSSSNFIEW